MKLAIAVGLAAIGLQPAQTPFRPAPGVVTIERVQLAVDRLLENRWYPTAAPPPGLADDRQVLQQALASGTLAIRRVAVRALGRFENPVDVPTLIRFLDDGNLVIRREASNAIGQALYRSSDVSLLPVQALYLVDLIDRMRYDAATAAKVEPYLLGQLAGRRADDTNVSGLLALIRQDSGRPVMPETRKRLRELAKPASVFEMPNRQALEALSLIKDDDASIPRHAALWRCPPPTGQNPTCGWEIRLIGVGMINAADPASMDVLAQARRDPAFQVRIQALRKLASAIPQTKTCAPLVDTIADFAEQKVIVKLEAVRLLDPRCEERDDIGSRLAALAVGLGDFQSLREWHLPARALESLARFVPDEAARLIRETAAGHEVWQVRAAAARASATLKDEAALFRLAGDGEPNVRTEALNGLAQLKSPTVTAAALTSLESSDYQLVMTAAGVLKGVKEKDAVIPALLQTLKRVTSEGKDTSREARLAIWDRLREMAAPDPEGHSPLLTYVVADELSPYLKDFDPKVASAAADVIGQVTGSRPSPDPTHRPPEQPSEDFLRMLRGPVATLVMESGDEITIELLMDEAPLTVARFVKLAVNGKYDGLTFHRVVPLFVIQGGSPGANEYSGDARYLRDEIGVYRHTRGAVGLSTRGRDTGDAQLFIDLIDLPRLNYDYTIFGRVVERHNPGARRWGLEAVDAVLEGAKIARILIEPPLPRITAGPLLPATPQWHNNPRR